jgi:hypothetical protein
MRPSLGRHRVLVAVPLTSAALERLDVFFDVDVDLGLDLSSELRDTSMMVAALRDKAGVVIDRAICFDALTLRRLPALKAIAMTSDVLADHADTARQADRDSGGLDLGVLTDAGIRATHVPARAGVMLDDDKDVDPGSIAVEGLVASLGFGRRSFHPPYLLNPEVACTSCC